MTKTLVLRAAGCAAALFFVSFSLTAAEPPAMNPFGKTPSSQRDDAILGCIELSNGTKHSGLIYLTRDKRFQVYDKEMQREREIPIHVIKKIECTVKKEWLEKEWKFRETANDEKLYTGRSYPVREYVHTITLKDDRTVTGALSAIVYIEPPKYGPVRPEGGAGAVEPERFLLHKRDKGEMGDTLKSLVYVKRITFNNKEEDEEETPKKATKSGAKKTKPKLKKEEDDDD